MKRIINLLLIWTFCVYCYSANNIISKTVSFISKTAVVSLLDDNGEIRFYIENSDNGLEPISAINNIVDSGGNICYPYLTYDGHILLFSARCVWSNNFDVYYSIFENNKWNEPIRFNDKINSEYDDVCPIISASGNDLFFVRRTKEIQKNKKEKYHTKLYGSIKDNYGEWNKSSHLIISKDGDMSPIILSDNEIIIFSSTREVNGKPSKIKNLYYTKKLRNYNWMDPILLTDNTPNSKNNPFYSYKTSLLSYFDDKGKICNVNVDRVIRKLPVINLVGNVFDVNNNGLKSTITVFDALTNQIVLKKESYSDGFFAFPLSKGKKYLVDINSNGYTHNFSYYDTSELLTDSTVYIYPKLSQNLDLTFNVFDKLLYSRISANIIITDWENNLYTNLVIDSLSPFSKRVLIPLGHNYKIKIGSNGYNDYVISLPKEKPIQFNKSSLDIELQPILKNIVIRVVDAESKELVNSNVELYNSALDETIEVDVNDAYNIDLREKGVYTLTATSKNYIFKLLTLDMHSINNYDTCIVEMSPIKSGEIVQLQNVNFAYNSSDILESSLKNLNNVLELLQTNPELRIQLCAHTDDIGGETYNLKLSNKRAESVMTYLLEKGVNPNRIEAKGYGMDKPLVPNDSEEHRALNRRVEFLIL